MKPLKIILIGIDGIYNYGCEAIVLGTEVILRNEYPDANIVYVTNRVMDDSKRLKNSKVQVIERGKLNKYSLKNIIRKVLSLVGIKWNPMVDSLKLVEGADAVFSIGGDIYTLGPDDSYSMTFPKFGDAVRKLGIPYVHWGASVGPFTENPKAEKAYTKHLKGLSLITARETSTVDYLKTLGVSDNVVSCADPAYAVAPEIKATDLTQTGKFTIAINLSPLSVHYAGLSLEDGIRAQAITIEKLINAFDARILLVPHVVIESNEGDDDLGYLQKIRKAVASKYLDSITLLESNPGFVGVKKELIKCNLVIAARMHCAVNAVTAHVPTLFVAYSRKAEGMCKYVYGNSEWVLPVSELTKEGALEHKVRSMMNQESKIRTFLQKRIPEIQQETNLPIKRLKEVLEHAESPHHA